jgi:MatE
MLSAHTLTRVLRLRTTPVPVNGTSRGFPSESYLSFRHAPRRSLFDLLRSLPPRKLPSYSLMLTLKALRKELVPTIQLAAPLVLGEIGWMSMGIVDAIMVGHLPNSAVAMGAVSLGSGIFTVLGWSGSGLLLGLDTLVAQGSTSALLLRQFCRRQSGCCLACLVQST